MDGNHEAERFIEGLLRKHLEFVSYPPTRPPTYVDPGGLTTSTLLLDCIRTLESWQDAIAASLLRAAMNATQNAGEGDNTTIISEFLQLAVDYLMNIDQETGVAFLYDVLTDLMRREEDGKDKLDSEVE